MKLSEIIPANEQLKIQELIDTHNTTNEFEVSLFSSQETSESLLTMEKFDNLISILTIVGERENVKPIYENTLDISFSIKLFTFFVLLSSKYIKNGYLVFLSIKTKSDPIPSPPLSMKSPSK